MVFSVLPLPSNFHISLLRNLGLISKNIIKIYSFMQISFNNFPLAYREGPGRYNVMRSKISGQAPGHYYSRKCQEKFIQCRLQFVLSRKTLANMCRRLKELMCSAFPVAEEKHLFWLVTGCSGAN